MHHQSLNVYPQNALQPNQFCLTGNSQMQSWNQPPQLQPQQQHQQQHQQSSFTNNNQTQQFHQQHPHHVVSQHQQATYNSLTPTANTMQNVSQTLTAQHHLNQQQQIHQMQNSNNYEQMHPPMPQPVIVKQEYPYGTMTDGSEQQTTGPSIYIENHGTTIHSSSPAQPVGSGQENTVRQPIYSHQQQTYQTYDNSLLHVPFGHLFSHVFGF